MNENVEQVLPENQAQEPLPLEEQVSLELVKHNYTEAKLKEFEEYLKLDIVDNDKESYLIIKDKRKEVKSWRVAVQKFCKFKREDANRVQKAWVAKENELVEKISKVEVYLEDKEEAYEKAIAEEKERKKREQEEQFILRQQKLSAMSVLYSDGMFTLGDVSFELSLIKECDKEIWEADILPKYEEAYKIIQAEALEQERIKQEREAELKRQQEELEQKQKELAEKEAALKAAQDEQERKQREEEEKKAAEAKAARDAKQKARIDQLSALGLKYDYNDNHFKGYGCFVPHLDIQCDNDEVWAGKVEKMTAHVAKVKEEEEQKRLAEIEAQKEAERIKTLGTSRMEVLRQYNAETDLTVEKAGKMDDVAWEIIRSGWQDVYEKQQREKWEKEQEEKRKLEEQKKAEELLQATEKEKWANIISQVNAIEIHDFKSGQYRKRATELRRLLDQIKAL